MPENTARTLRVRFWLGRRVMASAALLISGSVSDNDAANITL
jgi:hypothetical protein